MFARRIAGARLAAGTLMSLAAFAGATCGAAKADLALSTIIVDFADPQRRSTDIEVENKGKERLYVVAEPARIDAPGTRGERRVSGLDPEALGLLVSPARLVLEPGERKLLRFLVLQENGEQERIYRVTVKPVVGKVTAQQTAVKVVVGYDVLVVVRPKAPRTEVAARRGNGFLLLTNRGNTNVLLFDGKLCQRNCVNLETKRLYAGMEWRLPLRSAGTVTYKVHGASGVQLRKF